MEMKNRSSNSPSTFLEIKSRGKTSTFVSTPSKSILKFDNAEQGLEMLKISIKKEGDRRSKLRKLLERYNQIYAQEKKHVKLIKSSIIEMKDTNATEKFKILVEPTILVENSIKVETREFLCALMNTFYQNYDQNEKNCQAISNLNGTMAFLIKGISYSQDMLFLMQKSHINEQVQLEGELLTEKNKLKEQLLKQKQVKEAHSEVTQVHMQAKQKNSHKRQQLQMLRKQLQNLDEKASRIQQMINQKENIKMQCQDKIDTEIHYQEKLNEEVSKIGNQLLQKKSSSRKMLKELWQGEVLCLENGLKAAGGSNRTVGEETRKRMKFQIMCQFEAIRS